MSFPLRLFGWVPLACGIFVCEGMLAYHDGQMDGPLSPALYLLALLLPALFQTRTAVWTGISVLLLELPVRFVVGGSTALFSWGRHAGFWILFEGIGVLYKERDRARHKPKAPVSTRNAVQPAKRMSLYTKAPAQSALLEHAAQESLEHLRTTVRYTLQLLLRFLNLHTALVLWLDEQETTLQVSDLSCGELDLCAKAFPVQDGVLGGVLSRRDPLSLHSLNPSCRVPYYLGPCPVQSLLAIPLCDDTHKYGVLTLDRMEDRPFSSQEEEFARQAAQLCMQAVRNGQNFHALEQAKEEQGKLYQAMRILSAASGEAEVLRQGMEIVQAIVPIECAAVTLFDEATGMHEVRAMQPMESNFPEYTGFRFAHNTGLVSMAVQTRCPLPYQGDFDSLRQVVFTREAPWPDLPALRVLPLLLHNQVLGTWILSTTERGALHEGILPLLEVLASHFAVSLSNARMMQTLEQLAVSDSLTGLLNRRALMEKMQHAFASAVRFGQPLSVLVADLDYFKEVNDLHGHDVGDQVLQGFSGVLQRQKRNTDLVARFGGEEFVLVCPQTHQEGAWLLAERIRTEFATLPFPTPQGVLHVTCSFGIATCPTVGQTWDTLFSCADKALYASKRAGRNRVTCASSNPVAPCATA